MLSGRLNNFLIFIVFITMPLSSASAQTNTNSLSDSIEALIKHTLPNASVGIMVMDAETGELVYERHSFQAFTPASNTKLFTAAAALLELNKNFRFQTTLSAKKGAQQPHQINGHLYITFEGDPSLETNDIDNLFAALHRKGVHSIKGDLVIDDTLFKKPFYAPGWTEDTINLAFSAPVSSVILNQNYFWLTIQSNKTLNEPASVIQDHSSAGITILHKIKTVTSSKFMHQCGLTIERDQSNDFHFSGCWPITKHPKTLKIAFSNPNVYAKKIITEALAKNKIVLQGTVILGKTPSNAKAIVIHESQSLDKLLPTILKDSNNLYTESLTKTLGHRRKKSGTFKQGVIAIQSILHKHTDIDFNQADLYDGSGLSRYNLLTPRQITRLLYVVYHTPNISKTFRHALAQAGSTGTLQHRMRSFDFDRLIQAKTGSVKGASALSGYLLTNNRRQLIFSIMIDHIVGDTTTAQLLQTDICRLLIG